MSVQEKYLSFVDVVKRPGVYVDKRSNYLLKVTKEVIYTRARDGRHWDQFVSQVSQPNKKRFLRYSDAQAKTFK